MSLRYVSSATTEQEREKSLHESHPQEKGLTPNSDACDDCYCCFGHSSGWVLRDFALLTMKAKLMRLVADANFDICFRERP